MYKNTILIMDLRNVINKEFYPQRSSATPLHIMSAAMSVFVIPQPRGIKYSAFLYLIRKEYGVIAYLWDDLIYLDHIIQKRLKNDRKYYVKLKSRYGRDWREATFLFKKIDTLDLSTLAFKELSQLAQKASRAIALAVGIGHMIEPYAIAGDQRIRREVQKYVKDLALANRIFLSLTTPKTRSFASRAEESIGRLAEKKRIEDVEIKSYIQKFFWIQNSYSGRQKLSVRDVRHMVDDYQKQSRSEKKTLRASIEIKSYRLPLFLLFELKTLSFLSIWLDERKKNILIAIDYLDRVLEIIARKTDVPITLLRYLTPRELDQDPKMMQSILIKRRHGAVFLQTKNRIEIGFGKDFVRLEKYLNKEKNVHETELKGTSASLGKVIGRVRVCSTPASIQKVKTGDILVASMTRPEYLPAMRRAAAFVTDEGGITCHAAIVAREMGKPCVIGTRFATRFLKDNDIVEVKGNHGVVVVLKRSMTE